MFGKKTLAILLVIVMAASLLLGGCTKAKTPAEHWLNRCARISPGMCAS